MGGVVVFWGVGVWYVGDLRVDGRWMRKGSMVMWRGRL